MREGGTKRYRIMVGSMSWAGGMAAYLKDVWSSADGQNWSLETDEAGWGGREDHQALSHNGRLYVLGGNGWQQSPTMMCGRRRMVKTGCWKPMAPDGRSERSIKRYRIMVGFMSWAGMMAEKA